MPDSSVDLDVRGLCVHVRSCKAAQLRPPRAGDAVAIHVLLSARLEANKPPL